MGLAQTLDGLYPARSAAIEALTTTTPDQPTPRPNTTGGASLPQHRQPHHLRRHLELPLPAYRTVEYHAAHITYCSATADRAADGVSQDPRSGDKLAARADTTQTVISRLEGGAVTPTLPLLHRLASALEGELDLKITGTSLRAEFPLAS